MTRRLAYSEAAKKANMLVRLIEPGCHRIEIAGSIRRQEQTVKDIEIVCIPKIVTLSGRGLFPEEGSALESRLDGLLTSGRLKYDPALRRNGERYKRLLFDETPVDLFIVKPPATWGVILTLRTGPCEFSHRLVTKRSVGGLMPDGMKIEEGRLLMRDGLTSNWNEIETEMETDVFQALGLSWISPAERSKLGKKGLV